MENGFRVLGFSEIAEFVGNRYKKPLHDSRMVPRMSVQPSTGNSLVPFSRRDREVVFMRAIEFLPVNSTG